MSTRQLSDHPLLTLGAVARRFNVLVWQVRRVYERRLLPEPERAGPYRVVTEVDLPAIRQALQQAGYLPGGGGRPPPRPAGAAAPDAKG